MTDDIRAELREVVAQINKLMVRRDNLIRIAIKEKARVADLATDVKLSVARIYQIRDRRR